MKKYLEKTDRSAWVYGRWTLTLPVFGFSGSLRSLPATKLPLSGSRATSSSSELRADLALHGAELFISTCRGRSTTYSPDSSANQLPDPLLPTRAQRSPGSDRSPHLQRGNRHPDPVMADHGYLGIMGNNTADANNIKNIYIAVESVIGIIAILGNTLVIWAVKVNPALQDTTFYFIVSLASADLAVGILVMPLAIILSLDKEFDFYICLFMCCLIIILTNVSILSLLAIAVDRYLRIRIPTNYRTVMTKKRVSLCIIFFWSLSGLGAMVPMFGWNNRSKYKEPTIRCNFPNVISLDYLVYFCFFGWILIPLFFMVVLYVKIFYLMRKQIRQSANNFQSRGIYYRKEFKTATLLVLVLVLFTLCWLPISIVNCMNYFYPSVELSIAFQPVIFVSILLSHLNSALNPILYAFKIKKFKYTFLNIIRTWILCKAEASESPITENTLEKYEP
ncbi:adenosine receptor A3-like [Bombina bombina]|uniref:adenosine receptor A3-like n=1 Tax=Bombina bombina TaxID=8345 RepID=UPI00235AFAC9|nr:adenosine receptor A3-like [Bombina bombina]